MKLHTGERNYQCSLCNKDFIRAHHLQGHLRNAHKDVKVVMVKQDYPKVEPNV